MESYPIAWSQLARVEQVVGFKVKRSTGRHRFVCSRVQIRLPARGKDRDVRNEDPDGQPDLSSTPEDGRQTFGEAAMACAALRSCTDSDAPLCAALCSVLQNISDTNSLVFKQIRDKILSALCLCLRRREELAETSADPL